MRFVIGLCGMASIVVLASGVQAQDAFMQACTMTTPQKMCECISAKIPADKRQAAIEGFKAKHKEAYAAWEAAGARLAWARHGTLGEGATVCVIDTGVDVRHRDFRDADGRTRIAWLVDLEATTPHVLCKGEDWRDKGVVGREWVEAHGGQVVLVPLVPGRSTTNVIDRIRKSGG